LTRARALATLVRERPELISRARRHVDRQLERDQGTATATLEEWRSILEMHSLSRMVKFLTSESARAQRLRQSSPFWAVLTPEERTRIEGEDGQ